MKKLWLIVSALIVSIGTGYARDVAGVSLDCGKQRITAQTDLKSAKEGERVFIVAGNEDPSSGKTASLYGIQLSGKGKGFLSQPLIELLDASTKRVIRTITLGEYFGKESNAWKSLPDESTESAGKAVSAYSFTAKGQHFRFYRTIQRASDEHLPGGTGLTMTFSIAGETPMEMNMRFLGGCTGASGSEASSCFFGDSAHEQDSRAMLVVTAKPAGSITFDTKQGNRAPSVFTIESAPVHVAPAAQTLLVTLTIAGTTVGQPVHASKQAHNLVLYFNSQPPKPDLIAVTSVNQVTTKSGDTVLYTIEYHNIGTAAGKDVEIKNPVPAGTRYVENSAGGAGGTVDFTRSAENDVASIQWKFAVPILPGEHRSVGFKVVVQ